MPWLSPKNSIDEDVKSIKSPQNQHFRRSTNALVEFIPAQIDRLCGTSPAHHKQAMPQLLLNDLGVLGQNIHCLPAMMKASFSLKLLRNFFRSPYAARDTTLHGLLAIAQSLMLILVIPTLLTLPGFLSVMGSGICWIVTLAMTRPLHGPRIIISSHARALMTEDFSDERWIYVNGVMCSNRSLRSQCDRITGLFGRPVIGVHNRTSGLVGDLIICLIQRCFNLATPCTMALGSQLRDACLMNSVRKVIVLSHSTGAVHLSIALDQLHATLPTDVLSKLEIYTFGSAAPYLNNPCLRIESLHKTTDHASNLTYTRADGSIAAPVRTSLSSGVQRVEDHERVIPHIEHYALASDIFARFGVLHNTRNVLDNRLCGRVFVIDDRRMSKLVQNKRAGGGGFLMDGHYLDILFPSNAGNMKTFLEQVVEVDDQTAEKREFTAQGVALPQKAISEFHGLTRVNDQFSGCQNNLPNVSPKSHDLTSHVDGSRRTSWGKAAAMGICGVVKARAGVKECEGKTVRQLSRLWRYTYGGRPIGEGVTAINSVGHGLGIRNVSTYGIGEAVNSI